MSIGNYVYVKRGFLKVVCILHILFLYVPSSTAQDSTAGKNKWNLLVEPYLMFPNLKGTTGVGSLPDADVDADPGEVFSHFKIGAILYFEMAKDKWAFSSDIIYLNLDEDATTGPVINSGNVNLKQFLWEVAALRKLFPWLEAGIGGRLNSLKTSVDLVTKNIGGGTTVSSNSMTQTWFDPIIVARVKNQVDKKFLYQVRGDIGGFGIGSEFAWQLQAYAGYRFSKLFQATAGYKIISVDYNKGSGDDRFLFDMDTFGPVVRLGLNF
ncbi:MAG: hypothetical protein ACXWCG_09260 [Flavitalea sp.]